MKAQLIFLPDCASERNLGIEGLRNAGIKGCWNTGMLEFRDEWMIRMDETKDAEIMEVNL